MKYAMCLDTTPCTYYTYIVYMPERAIKYQPMFAACIIVHCVTPVLANTCMGLLFALLIYYSTSVYNHLYAALTSERRAISAL